MRTILLNDSAWVVLDASGNGVATLTPRPAERWHAKTVAVTTSTANVVPQATLYVGDSTAQMNEVDSTVYGSHNVSDVLTDYDIPPGAKVFARWTGGDPGAIATLTVRGTKDVSV